MTLSTGTGGVMQRRLAVVATALLNADAVHDDDAMKSDLEVTVDIDIEAHW